MVKQTYGYIDHKDAISKRLNRAEGQIRGISKMVEDDKYCIDILTQISAARSALDKVATELVRDHAKHCMVNAKDDAEKKAMADELVTAIGRML
jgi:CsoR family transcriptional regulator, copper-sensing transcriptional repressor